DDVPLLRHRGVRDEPVALHLRDEPANPRPELDALRVELDFRTELSAAALVVERFTLHVTLQIAQRVAERSAGRPAAPRRTGARSADPARRSRSDNSATDGGLATGRSIRGCTNTNRA